MPHEAKTERVQLLMSRSEVAAIDDYGWRNRIRTRAEAIRQLVKLGMQSETTKADVVEAMESATDVGPRNATP